VCELLDEHVHLGGVPGAANVGLKGSALVAALLTGAKWINDVAVLRAGETAKVLGHWVAAASTMGTFLRAFTWGHVRQLDAVNGELLQRAWRAGAGPEAAPLTIDVDSTDLRDLRAAEAGWVEVHVHQGARLSPTGGRGRGAGRRPAHPAARWPGVHRARRGGLHH